jgi:hypothetical protein
MNFAEIAVNEARKSNEFIKLTMKDLSKEFDKYMNVMREVPWWYNERAILGFYISGLLRNKKHIVLQEFCCKKGKKAIEKGRADLLFKYSKDFYLTEAKLCWTSIDTQSDFKKAEKWAKRVLQQANKYAQNESGMVKKKNIFSLCFEIIYCRNKSYSDYSQLIKGWSDAKEALRYLHFYSLIQLKESTTTNIEFRENNYCYPGIAVYGLFNK